MSKFVAVLAWLSFFGLVWGALLNERLQNSQAMAGLCLFAAIALVSSGIQSKKEEPKK